MKLNTSRDYRKTDLFPRELLALLGKSKLIVRACRDVCPCTLALWAESKIQQKLKYKNTVTLITFITYLYVIVNRPFKSISERNEAVKIFVLHSPSSHK